MLHEQVGQCAWIPHALRELPSLCQGRAHLIGGKSLIKGELDDFRVGTEGKRCRAIRLRNVAEKLAYFHPVPQRFSWIVRSSPVRRTSMPSRRFLPARRALRVMGEQRRAVVQLVGIEFGDGTCE